MLLSGVKKESVMCNTMSHEKQAAIVWGMRHAALRNTTCPEREAASELGLKATTCKAMSDMGRFQTYDMNIIRESQLIRKTPLSA